jgi:hypothetical protein
MTISTGRKHWHTTILKIVMANRNETVMNGQKSEPNVIVDRALLHLFCTRSDVRTSSRSYLSAGVHP